MTKKVRTVKRGKGLTTKKGIPKPQAKPLTRLMKKFLKDLRSTEDALESSYNTGLQEDQLDKWLRSSSKFRSTFYDILCITERQVQWLKMFVMNHCNVQKTCDQFGISRRAYQKWRKTNEAFLNMERNAKEGLIDFVESKLIENIKQGKEKSIMFFLKSKARERGYADRTSIDMDLKASVNFKQLADEDLDNEIRLLEQEQSKNHEGED